MATATEKKPVAPASEEAKGLVLDKEWFDDFVSRKIGGVVDIAVLQKAREYRQNTVIFGPTGPGKTSLVMAYAALEGLPFYDIRCNGALDPSHLFGKWLPKEDGQGYRWADGPVTIMVRNGGVLYLDEVNFMPPKIGSVLHGALDKRRTIVLMDHAGEIIKAHPDFQVVASYNPGYEGTRPLNEAFFNRFAFKLRYDYDTRVESKLVSSKSLIDMAKQLRTSHLAGELRTPVSTNMLMEFEDFAVDKELGFDFAVEMFMASFKDDEVPSVKKVAELYSDRIKAELGIT